MAANQLLSLPAASAGAAPASAASSWGFGSYVEIISASSNTVARAIIGITFQVTNIPALDTTHQLLFNIAIGAFNAEYEILQIPYSFRNDTQVGYYHTKTLNVYFPEPYILPVGQRIAVQAADTLASAITYNGFKLLYEEKPESFEQVSYRFYSDGTESASSALEPLNTNYTADVTSGDVNLGLRVTVKENNGGSGASTDDYQLQYSKNSGAYANVGTGAVIGYNSSNLTDGNATTKRLGATATTIFSDDFADGTQASFWPNSYDSNATRAETGGQLVITLATTADQYCAYVSNNVSLVNRSISIEVTEVSNTATVAQTFMQFAVTPTNGLTIVQENGSIYFQKQVAGSYTNIYSETYSSVTHKYWRIRTSGDMCYWETSTDNTTWTIKASETVPIDVSSGRINVGAGTYSITVSPGQAKFDNFLYAEDLFIPGQISEDGLADNLKITPFSYTELLYSLTIKQNDVADNDTLDFRVVRNGTVIDTYTQTPRITVEEVSATVLTPADALHNHSSDTTAITQTHVLAAQEALHAQAVDNTTIALLITLQPADSAHTLTSDGTSITQTHVLTTQDTAHATTSDVTTITQTHVLSTSDTAHAQTSDNTAITQTHVLVTNDTAHSVTSDNTAITQTHILTTADTLHAQTSDNVNLILAGSLAPDDSAHGQTVDNTTITQTHVIAVNDATHAQTVDNAAITQTVYLVVNETTHAQQSDVTTITQTHILISTKATHSQTADNTTLTSRAYGLMELTGKQSIQALNGNKQSSTLNRAAVDNSITGTKQSILLSGTIND